MSAALRVVVLGGYGRFGSIIAARLAADARFEVIVAGRDAARAEASARSIGARGLALDHAHPGFATTLRDIAPGLVIDTAGPFAAPHHPVAEAAIAARAHCVDIADSRAYVCGITRLDPAAREAGVLVVAGASSVPGLSSAVVDHFAPRFARVEAIDMGICASSRLPGVATVRSVLSYWGAAIPAWRHGAEATAVGGAGLRRHRFAHRPLARWMCDCDVPDLVLLPRRVPGLRELRFGAGTGLAAVQWGLWAFAGLARAGAIDEPAAWSRALHRMGSAFGRFGDGRSAMFVTLRGQGADGRPLEVRWELHAEAEDGPNIPCLGAVALARKLAADALPARGAMPCVGLLSLDDWMREMEGLRVHAHADERAC